MLFLGFFTYTHRSNVQLVSYPKVNLLKTFDFLEKLKLCEVVFCFQIVPFIFLRNRIFFSSFLNLWPKKISLEFYQNLSVIVFKSVTDTFQSRHTF